MELRDVHSLLGRTAYDVDGDRLGTVTGAYVDDSTGRPSWVTVERGGLFRTTRSFVPLDGAEAVRDGVRLGVASEAVRRAPHVDEDRVLTRDDEQELLRHYGLASPGDAPAQHEATAPAGDAVLEPAPDAHDDVDTGDPAPGAMTLSEERARVGTTTVATSRAVLRTTRVTEDHTFYLPLGRDQVEVVYEPLPQPVEASSAAAPAAAPPAASEGDGAVDGDIDGDDDGWVVLYEERLVVRTEWVPVERVRLRTAAVQGESVVDVDLRRERIDVDVEPAGDAPPRDRT